MAAIEVLGVEPAPAATDKLAGASIEIPTGGSSTDTHVLHVAGWVVGSSSRATSVEILESDRVIRRVSLAVPRPDIAAAHPGAPERCGFEEILGVLGFGSQFELRLVAVLESGERVPIGTIGARRPPLHADVESSLRPIMVSCLGRAGTTLLMRCLAADPSIVVYRRYPYESSPARYWLHVLRVLSEPANFVDSTHPDKFLDEIWNVGYNPFFDYGVAVPDQSALYRWAGGDYVSELASFCARSIEGWYRAVADVQGQADAVYFAEKHMWPGYTQGLMWELFPRAKEIFLVRDFRDLVSSILAFDRKRGFAGFRRSPGKDDESYVREDLGMAAAMLAQAWRDRRDRSHLLRYEDLVLRPRETVSSLLDYLELAGGERAAERMLAPVTAAATQSDHRTSNDPRASIGRWRREQRDLQELCQEVFRGPLEEFGYSR